jgi:hypothetical protein
MFHYVWISHSPFIATRGLTRATFINSQMKPFFTRFTKSSSSNKRGYKNKCIHNRAIKVRFHLGWCIDKVGRKTHSLALRAVYACTISRTNRCTIWCKSDELLQNKSIGKIGARFSVCTIRISGVYTYDMIPHTNCRMNLHTIWGPRKAKKHFPEWRGKNVSEIFNCVINFQ